MNMNMNGQIFFFPNKLHKHQCKEIQLQSFQQVIKQNSNENWPSVLWRRKKMVTPNLIVGSNFHHSKQPHKMISMHSQKYAKQQPTQLQTPEPNHKLTCELSPNQILSENCSNKHEAKSNPSNKKDTSPIGYQHPIKQLPIPKVVGTIMPTLTFPNNFKT